MDLQVCTRPIPVAGESLASILHCAAFANRSSYYDIFKRFGYTEKRLRSHLVLYDPGAFTDRLASALGLSVTELQQRLLSRHAGRAFTPSKGTFGGPLKHTGVSQVGSAFCPKCVDENHGAWKLEWLLPFVVACSHHGCLLVESCQRCGKATGPLSHLERSTPPGPGSCRCGFDLRSARQQPAARSLVEAQRRLIDLAGNTVVPLDVIDAVAFLDRRLDGILETAVKWPTKSVTVQHLARATDLAFQERLTKHDRRALGLLGPEIVGLRHRSPELNRLLREECNRKVGRRSLNSVLGDLQLPPAMESTWIPDTVPATVWGQPLAALTGRGSTPSVAELQLAPILLRGVLHRQSLGDLVPLGSRRNRYAAFLTYAEDCVIDDVARRLERFAQWCVDSAGTREHVAV